MHTKKIVKTILPLIILSIFLTGCSIFTKKSPPEFIEQSAKYMQGNDYESLTRLTYKYEGNYNDNFYKGQKKFVDFVMKQDEEAFNHLNNIEWELSLSGIIGGLKKSGTIAVKLEKDLKKLMTTDKEVINWKDKIDLEIQTLREEQEKNKIEKEQKAYRIQEALELKKQEQRNDKGREFGFRSYPIDTFIDKDTKLMWEDTELYYTGSSTYENWRRNFRKAKYYCENLSIGEYSDWRLPTKTELLSIVDYNKIVDSNEMIDNIVNDIPNKPAIKDGFKNVACEASVGYETPSYWSASKESNSKDSKVFAVQFIEGRGHFADTSKQFYMRCVRNN